MSTCRLPWQNKHQCLLLPYRWTKNSWQLEYLFSNPVSKNQNCTGSAGPVLVEENASVTAGFLSLPEKAPTQLHPCPNPQIFLKRSVTLYATAAAENLKSFCASPLTEGSNGLQPRLPDVPASSPKLLPAGILLCSHFTENRQKRENCVKADAIFFAWDFMQS